MWEVEYTDQFGEWYLSLSDADQERVVAAVEFLGERGPGLGRPHVDSITASRHSNMKELRPRGGQLRVLFAFDPRRIAILLLGGEVTRLIGGNPGMTKPFPWLIPCTTLILRRYGKKDAFHDFSSSSQGSVRTSQC